MKQSKDTLFLSSVLKLRFVTVSFISASQTSRCLMSKAHNVMWCWVPGCLKLWEEVKWDGSVPIQLAVTASSNSLKICRIIYNDVQTRVSLSLSLSHTHSDNHLLEVNYPLLYTACDFITPLSSSYFCGFQQSGPNYFSPKFLNFKVQKAATVL
jgi:hypothetical protein